MKKQLILTIGALSIVILLFLFGRTVATKSKTAVPPAPRTAKIFDINQYIIEEKQHLTPSQALSLIKLEDSLAPGDGLNRQIAANMQLANFWKDSSHAVEPYLFYLAEAAKLDKSEKNLTFAAQLILNNLRGEADEAKLNWKAEQAIALFEKAIEANPDNNDLRVGLGACYIFGKGRSGRPEETMKGVQQLLAVAQKDSTNMKAQLMLGVGGYVSGQYDKAIVRLQKVLAAEPGNLEAIAFLADTYAAKGDKEEAIRWYQVSKRLTNDPHYSKEVDKRIKSLR